MDIATRKGHLNKAEKSEMRIAIIKLILPIITSSMLEMLVGFVSMALIGNLGALAIGAMALSQRVRGIIWSVFKGIGIGLQVVVAQSIGAGQEERAGSAITQTLVSIFTLSLLFMGTMLIFPSAWLSLFNPQSDLLASAITVLKIIAVGFPFLGIVMVVSSGLQGRGDAVTPLYINGLMNLLNIFLGLWLVNGGFGIPSLGLLGAAYAMVIAQFLAACYAVWHLVHAQTLKKPSHFNFLKLCFSPLSQTVFKIGFPSVLEALFWNVSSIFLARFILVYGNNALAAYQLGFQAESIAFMPAVAFQVASTAFVGRYIAAKETQKARAYFNEIAKWSLSVSLLASLLLVFLPHWLLGFMTKDSALLQLASLYLFFCGIAQAPQNLAGVIGGALRGAGYTNLPMITAGIAIYGIRLPLAFVSAYIFKWPVYMIFIAIAIDMVLRLLLNGLLYMKINIYKKPKIV